MRGCVVYHLEGHWRDLTKRSAATVALCRLLMMKEGALEACKSLLRDGDASLSSSCLKTVTLFAQNQYRAYIPTWGGRLMACLQATDLLCLRVAAEAIPKLIDPRTVKALVHACASRDVRFTGILAYVDSTLTWYNCGSKRRKEMQL